MKIVFSRKGFDMGSGGTPSPIIDGVPVSLPIPGGPREIARYHSIEHPIAGSLGPVVEKVTKKRIPGDRWAHHDPVLPRHFGQASLGQMGEAQSHLENQGVGPGDIFLFFGLFRDYTQMLKSPQGMPHHRIFGFLQVERMERIGKAPAEGTWKKIGLEAPHPHTERRDMRTNNTVWIGRGAMAASASDALRLTAWGENTSNWIVPSWLQRYGLTYHAREERWSDGRLRAVGRGQEFVTDVGDDPEALTWVNGIIGEMAEDLRIAA